MEQIAILSLLEFTAAQLEKFRSVSTRFVVEQLPEATIEAIPPWLRESVQVLYGWGDPLGEAHHFPRLRWVQTHSAGVDYLYDTPTWQSDILISSLNGIHATPMAEHALAMMLALRQRVPTMIRNQLQATWPSGRWEIFSRPELRGSILGIVGYGAVGREVARLAKSFGMRILAVNRSGERQPYRGYAEPGIGDPTATIPEAIFPSTALVNVLPDCDFVVLTAPLTAETHHIINVTTLTAMKPTAYLLNLGRGPLVDETALIKALQQNSLAGAGLDVFETEPLPAESTLWQLENVIISPHVSGFTPQYDERASDLFAENLRRFLNGEPLINLVVKERGY